MSNLDEESLHRALASLHEAVDSLVAGLTATHRERLECTLGCTGCCVDDLTVFPIEAARIQREADAVLNAAPHPAGACAFLDAQGACRIYDQRPYVCRTQGLPLRWLESRGEQTVELRDICELNEGVGKSPIETLDASECWSIGPVEEQLAALQRAYGGELLTRQGLRELFAAPADTGPL